MIIRTENNGKEFMVTIDGECSVKQFRSACKIIEDNLFPEVWSAKLEVIGEMMDASRIQVPADAESVDTSVRP